MRLLLTTSPAVGHAVPLLPLAAAAVRAGDAVALLGAQSIRALTPPGAEYLQAGLELGELFEIIRNRPPRDPPVDPRSARAIGLFFGALRAQTTVDDAHAAARGWRPDVIVSEGLDSVGPIVAARLDIPHVWLSLGPVCSAEVEAEITGALDSVGYERPAAALRLDPWPARLQPPAWQGPFASEAIRPGLAELPNPSHPPRPPFPEGPGPAVLFTMGTVFDEPTKMQGALDALSAAGVRVACAAGPRLDPTAVRVDPGRVTIHRFGPLAPLLDAADAVVCHGGAGTVLAAAAKGLPLLVMPQGADHHLTAAAVDAAGVGQRLPEDTSPDRIAEAATSVVASATYRHRAAELAAEIATMPTPEQVLGQVHTLRG